jgi:hypothetical protein
MENAMKTSRRIYEVIATCWREVTGLAVVKVVMVMFASTYRGPQSLSPAQMQEALVRYFEVDTASFLASLEPAFMFLLLSTILTMTMVVVIFGAIGPKVQGTDDRRAAVLTDFSVLVGAVLTSELVAGTAGTVLAVRFLPQVTLGVALRMQAMVAVVTVVSVLPLVSAMVLLRTVIDRRLLRFALGLTLTLGLRYGYSSIIAVVPAYRIISQHEIESLLMTGELDRFVLGALLAAAWSAALVATARYVAERPLGRLTLARPFGRVARTGS